MQFSLSAITGCGQDEIGIIIIQRFRIRLWYLLLFFFIMQASRIRKYSKEEKDELAIRNLWRVDAIGLKIMMAAVIIIAFACAVTFLDGRMAGYALVGMVFVLTVIRFIVFCVMDSKGV